MQSTIAIPGSEDFCCVFLVEAFFKLWNYQEFGVEIILKTLQLPKYFPSNHRCLLNGIVPFFLSVKYLLSIKFLIIQCSFMQSTIAIPGSEDFCCVFLVEAFFKLWTTINLPCYLNTYCSKLNTDFNRENVFKVIFLKTSYGNDIVNSMNYHC
jgi:hypothetical protein